MSNSSVSVDLVPKKKKRTSKKAKTDINCCTWREGLFIFLAILTVCSVVVSIISLALLLKPVPTATPPTHTDNFTAYSSFNCGTNSSAGMKRSLEDSVIRYAFTTNKTHITHSVQSHFLEIAFFEIADLKKAIFEELNSQKGYIKELEAKVARLDDIEANEILVNKIEVFESLLLSSGINLEILGDLIADYGFFNFQVEALAGYFNLLDAALINATSMTASLGNFTAGITIRYDWQVVGCQPRYASTILITVRDGPSPAPIYGDTVDIYVTECEHGSILYLFDFGITTFFPIVKSTRTTILFDEPFCDRLIIPQGFQLYGKTSGVGADVDQPTSFYYDAAVGACGFSSTQTITQAGSSQISLAFVLP